MTTKKVKGKSLLGKEKTYSFNLINAKDGTRIFHQYVPELVQLLPDGVDLSKLGEGIDLKLNLDIKSIVESIVDFLPFDKLEELAKTMLGGGSVDVGDKILEMGDDGFGEYATGDPLEVYTALLYAFKANFPDYIDPLFETLEVNQGANDSISQNPKMNHPK